MDLPINVGERVVVLGWNNLAVRVVSAVYVSSEARWHITLDWGEHGLSHVYDTDEGRTWYRYSATN